MVGTGLFYSPLYPQYLGGCPAQLNVNEWVNKYMVFLMPDEFLVFHQYRVQEGFLGSPGRVSPSSEFLQHLVYYSNSLAKEEL